MPTTYLLKSKDGKIIENLSASEIRNLAKAGKVNAEDFISKTNSNKWIAAYNLKGFDIPKPKQEEAITDKTRLPKKPEAKDTKICPYCAEEIKKDSKICRFCRMDLAKGKSIDTPESTPTKEVIAKSGILDGVKIGCGMFFVLPVLIILGIIALFSFIGGIGGLSR
ncbi:MAG: hypothetical protein V2B19_20860 [Pseudomonadota bacterium]